MKAGEYLRETRKKRKLSQTELAERLGVSQMTISRWEDGTTAIPFESFPKISKTFDISMSELVSNVFGLELELPNDLIQEAILCGRRTINLARKKNQEAQVKHKCLQISQSLTANDWDRLCEIIMELSLIAESEFKFFYEVLKDKELTKTKKYIIAFANALNSVEC